MGNQHYNTPPEVLDVIRWYHGRQIDLDPCSNDGSIVNAIVNIKPPEDGLMEAWEMITDPGGLIYVNPPFREVPKWLAKGRGVDRQIIYLVPASVESNWFHDALDTHMAWLPRGRVKFWINGKEDPRPTGGVAILANHKVDWSRLDEAIGRWRPAITV